MPGMTEPLTDERLSELKGEYEGYEPSLKSGNVYGTMTMGELFALIAAEESHRRLAGTFEETAREIAFEEYTNAERNVEWSRNPNYVFCQGCGQEIDRDKLAAYICEALASIHKTEMERAAALVEQIAKPDDDSAAGEEAADAFNDAANRPMSERLQAWNAAIAAAIRRAAAETN